MVEGCQLEESLIQSLKGMEIFDVKRLPAKVATPVNALLDGFFVDRTENALVFENPGRGKASCFVPLARS